MLQSNQVLSFFRPSARGDWSQRELEEVYRVEDALTKSGVAISVDRGLTDEGEPWFVALCGAAIWVLFWPANYIFG